MARIFIYDNREFPDPDPKLTVDQVRQNMAAFFPELANAEVKGPTKRPNPKEPGVTDDVYTFVKRVGTKGKEKACRLGHCETKSINYGGGTYETVAAAKKGECPICGNKMVGSNDKTLVEAMGKLREPTLDNLILLFKENIDVGIICHLWYDGKKVYITSPDSTALTGNVTLEE